MEEEEGGGERVEEEEGEEEETETDRDKQRQTGTEIYLKNNALRSHAKNKKRLEVMQSVVCRSNF